MQQNMRTVSWLILALLSIVLTLPTVYSQGLTVSIDPTSGSTETAFQVTTAEGADCGVGTGPGFSISNNQPGTYTVTCRDSAGNEATAQYTVTSPPGELPTPPDGTNGNDTSQQQNVEPLETDLPATPDPLPTPTGCEVATWSYTPIRIRNEPSTRTGEIVSSLQAFADPLPQAVGFIVTDEGLWYKLNTGNWIAGNHSTQGQLTRLGTDCDLPSLAPNLPQCTDPGLQAWLERLPYFQIEAYGSLGNDAACEALRIAYLQSIQPPARLITESLPRRIYTDCPELLPEWMSLLNRMKIIDEDIFFAVKSSMTDENICAFAGSFVRQSGLSLQDIPSGYEVELAPLACLRGISNERYNNIVGLAGELEIQDDDIRENTCQFVNALNLLGAFLPPDQDALYEKLTSPECGDDVPNRATALDYVVQAAATNVDISRILPTLCTSDVSVATLLRDPANRKPAQPVPLTLIECQERFALAVTLFMNNHYGQLLTVSPQQAATLLSAFEDSPDGARCQAVLDYLRIDPPTSPSESANLPGTGSSQNTPQSSEEGGPSETCAIQGNCDPVQDSEGSVLKPPTQTPAAAILVTGSISEDQPGNIFVLQEGVLAPLLAQSVQNITYAVLSPNGHYAIYYISDVNGNIVSVNRVAIAVGQRDEDGYPIPLPIWIASSPNTPMVAPYAPDWYITTNSFEQHLLLSIVDENESGASIHDIAFIDQRDSLGISSSDTPLIENAANPDIDPQNGFLAFQRRQNEIWEIWIYSMGSTIEYEVSGTRRGGESILPPNIDCENPQFGSVALLYFTCDSNSSSSDVYVWDQADQSRISKVDDLECLDAILVDPGIINDSLAFIVDDNVCFVSSTSNQEQNDNPAPTVPDLLKNIREPIGGAIIIDFAWAEG
jgi:hypothetical protein